MRRWFSVFACSLVLLLPHTAQAAPPDPVAVLDDLWMLLAAGLVLLMQAGFMFLEAGHVRSKNSINVAQKNLMDFVLCSLLFGLVGAGLMFGQSAGGFIGFSTELMMFGETEDWSAIQLIFQMMFAGTAATILSGAVAERMTMPGYMLCTALIALFIYPVVGHWAWGGKVTGSEDPLLASWGFMDFAGGTVVHSVGAWVGLAAIIEIGSRRGKFTPEGDARTLHGHSPVLATAGCLILWVGWIGFNAGNVSPSDPLMAEIVINTIVAGACGGIVAMVFGRMQTGLFRPEVSINGVLGGLVAITPACDVVSPVSACLIGIGASLVVSGASWLLTRFKLDDPLGAIPVHGFAGAWGTIMIAVLGDEDLLLTGNRLEQLGVQALGVGLVFAFAFGTTFLFLRAGRLFHGPNPEKRSPFRVSEQAEIDGLNVHEHGATMGITTMQKALAEFAESPHGVFHSIDLEPDDEAYEMSLHFNEILNRLEEQRREERQRMQAELQQNDSVAIEIRKVINAATQGDFSQRMDLAGKEGFVRAMADDINNLCEVTASGFNQVRETLQCAARGDFQARFEGDYIGTMAEIQSGVNTTLEQLGSAFGAVEALVDQASQGLFSGRIDTHDKEGSIARLCSGVNRICEISEKGLTDLANRLSAMADGDMTLPPAQGYEGQFAEIMKAMHDTTLRISTLLHGIADGSNQVECVSQSIAGAADTIKAASSAQSETLDHLCDTLGQVEQTTRAQVQRTSQAKANCDLACERAGEGVTMTAHAVKKMAEISEAAQDITGTVRLIQGIARQTHLLSINASVEAARSSEDNAGFRVVAEEVRNLAAETAEAAARITEKAQFVRQVVTDQEELVGDIATQLEDMRNEFIETSALVQDLARSGEIEATRLTESVKSLTDVHASALKNAEISLGNQRNVVTLNASSQIMSTSISKFKILDEGRMKRAA